MTKENLEKEAREKYHNHKIMDFQGFYNHHYYYLGYVEGAEPREKRIAELEEISTRLESYYQNQKVRIAELEEAKANLEYLLEGRDNEIDELKKENKDLAQNLEDTEILNNTYEKRFDNLKKENTELKEENKKWKDEWQEQVQEATEEGYARTLQTMQLTKAKRLLKILLEDYVSEPEVFSDGSCEDNKLCNLINEAEQFLNSEVEK